MKLLDLFKKYNLEKSLLIGYYGGGNYGDELLLEVLANLLQKNKVKDITVTYQKPEDYRTYHHDFGYKVIKMSDKKKLLQTILKNDNIIIGGGGLWGLDVNPNIFILSSILFMSKYVLRKKVFLLGVGYYSSTSRLGHVSAFLAGKSATHIIARDAETLHNFKKVTKHVGLDTDIAWNIPALDLSAYDNDLKELDKTMPVKEKTQFVTLRRFRANQTNTYSASIEKYIKSYNNKPIILGMMEPKEVDPEGFAFAQALQKKYKNITLVTDFSYNPLALYLYFKKHKKHLVVIAPQFHTIITAYLNDLPFLPIAYDNKVTELFKYIGQSEIIPVKNLKPENIVSFVDSAYKDVS